VLSSPPLALYVHFPWCVRKCPYCDFNSYTLHGALPAREYVDLLLRDLARRAPGAGGRALISVFLGGGTPSLFPAEAIGRVLEGARALIGLEPDVEVTLEANPGTIERGRFAEYRAAGVNRVSLGAQSFDPQRLRALGRIHTPDDTRRAADELHAAGLHNFNLDLMYALPGQDLGGALADLEAALALQPAHLSHYQLTLEPGTVFAAERPELPEDDAAADMLSACEARLGAAGFSQYEVSAYARTGRRARHNCNYWTFGDYIGIGAGAHGKLTDPGQGHILRTRQTREPRRYLASGVPEPVTEPVAPQDLPFEFLMNALRLSEGFALPLFESRTGLKRDAIVPTLSSLQADGLLVGDTESWRTTRLGARFLNEVLLRFLPEGREGDPRRVST